MDVPPQSDQQAPSLPAVPGQRPGNGVPVLPPLPKPPVRRRRNWRLFVVVFLGMLAPVFAGSSVAFYAWYDRSTGLDRSSPTVVVRDWIRAYLGEHDDSEARLYSCSDQSGLAEVKALRDDLGGREQSFGITISVSYDSVRETSRAGQRATVRASIVLAASGSGTPLRRVQTWDFDTVNDSGWRVCGAHKVG